MSSEQPRPGDKVRVTSIVSPNGSYAGLGAVSEPNMYSATVEILERADNPADDPVGTVATLKNVVWVKRSDFEWTPVQNGWKGIFVNAQMRGREVTGAVPGTPAAAAQRENDVLVSRFRALREPAEARRDDQGAACGKYDPKGELGGVIYTTCLNCGFGAAAHGKPGPLVVQYGDREPRTVCPCGHDCVYNADEDRCSDRCDCNHPVVGVVVGP